MKPIPLDLSYWVIQCLSMALVALLIPKLRVTSIFGPLLAVAALSAVNTAVWSSELFTMLPNDISVHTLTLIAINGAIFWLIVKIVPGIETSGILPSLVAPIVFSLCTIFVPRITAQMDWGSAALKAQQVISEAKKFVRPPAQ